MRKHLRPLQAATLFLLALLALVILGPITALIFLVCCSVPWLIRRRRLALTRNVDDVRSEFHAGMGPNDHRSPPAATAGPVNETGVLSAELP